MGWWGAIINQTNQQTKPKSYQQKQSILLPTSAPPPSALHYPTHNPLPKQPRSISPLSNTVPPHKCTRAHNIMTILENNACMLHSGLLGTHAQALLPRIMACSVLLGTHAEACLPRMLYSGLTRGSHGEGNRKGPANASF